MEQFYQVSVWVREYGVVQYKTSERPTISDGWFKIKLLDGVEVIRVDAINKYAIRTVTEEEFKKSQQK